MERENNLHGILKFYWWYPISSNGFVDGNFVKTILVIRDLLVTVYLEDLD